MDSDERHERAKKAYKQYMGRDYRMASTPYDPPSIKEISQLTVDRCYGDSWSKTRLDMKTKSLITLSMLIGLGNLHELKTHLTAAHHQGVSKDEIVEWLVHVNSYLGTPRSVEALRVARQVWKEMAEGKPA